MNDTNPITTDAGTQYDLLGEIYVDSGLVLVGDPCYRREGSGNQAAWEAFCHRITSTGGDEPLGEGLGLTVSCDDGIYPVFAETDPETGRVLAITIEFDMSRFDD